MKRAVFLAVALLVAAPFVGQDLQAQFYGSLGGGIAKATGDFSDNYDMGLTFRGQAGISLAIVDAHLQTGVTSFGVADDPDNPDADDVNIYHAGIGARVGLGFVFIGANAAYFFGDGEDGIGLFPEIGVRIWRLEAVADYRIDGDENWGAVRLNWRF